MKKLILLLLLFLSASLSWAQFFDPVHWQAEERQTEGKLILQFQAKIDHPFHIYGLQLPVEGPQATELHTDAIEGLEAEGNWRVVKGKSLTISDTNFGGEIPCFENEVTLEQTYRITASRWNIQGYILFMACNDEMCIPPSQFEFHFEGTAKVADGTEKTGKKKASDATVNVVPTSNKDNSGTAELANEATPVAPIATPSPVEASPIDNDKLWAPVIDELRAFGSEADDVANTTHSGWYIFLAGFLAGLIALVTPCVWPMIPMTVSFFLKRTKDRRQSLRDAYIYGISIIVIYVLLGLAVTVIFGASALNSLATNAVFNILFFLLLVVFALSFFGAFELVLPASWTTQLDQKADTTTGLLSIFFMAFTLCLVSFSCTGPIIGTLLVEAATSGSMFYPAIGMTGFALALSLPFTLFALFPSMLKAMPKSGGWLNRVKVVLGFCELALSLKFLSVADLAYGWGILDREVFLALWIIIFLLLGLYLLGFIRLPHDDDPQPSDRVSVGRMMMAMISLSFALYMVPGLWGAPCKAISAFTPPLSTQDFKLGEETVTAYHDYDEGMAAARRTGKPVLVDFSGFGCVNCRKMEAAVWTAPEVKRLIDEEYILIELMVDDKTPLPGGKQYVRENDKDVAVRTYGDLWSYLQRHKFGANAQPFYVLLDAEGHPLTGSYSYNEDVDAYVKFLSEGLHNFRK
ncbi:MAG: thioredoxin family protein [Bacteroidales bacterium]|nr:thioredoxin family protein [Bacteroidales bacterium]